MREIDKIIIHHRAYILNGSVKGHTPITTSSLATLSEGPPLLSAPLELPCGTPPEIYFLVSNQTRITSRIYLGLAS